MTTRLDTSRSTRNGEQAGLVIWKSESPNTFSKIVAIQSGGGNHQFEHIVTQDGGVDPPIPSSITPAPGGQLPAQVLLRARYDGTKVIGEFSRRRRRDLDADRPGGPCGAARGAAAGRPRRVPRRARWRHRHVRLVPRARGLRGRRPVRLRAATCVTRSDEFDGDARHDRWSFRIRTTPATGARSVGSRAAVSCFPLGYGAIDGAKTGAITFVGQDAARAATSPSR